MPQIHFIVANSDFQGYSKLNIFPNQCESEKSKIMHGFDCESQ